MTRTSPQHMNETWANKWALKQPIRRHPPQKAAEIHFSWWAASPHHQRGTLISILQPLASHSQSASVRQSFRRGFILVEQFRERRY